MNISFQLSSDFWTSLSVERVLPTHYSDLSQTAEMWKDIAEQKEEQAELQGYNARVFHDSQSVTEFVSILLRDLIGACHEVYVCHDESHRKQGIMILENPSGGCDSSELVVKLLATHPRNIRSVLNAREVYVVRGVGTALMGKAEERLLELDKTRLVLNSTFTADGFYERRGYVPEPFEGGICFYKTVSMVVESIFANMQAA